MPLSPTSPGFGIEIECYLPAGGTTYSAAAAVAHRTGVDCRVEGYNHGLRTWWKVVTDGSLHGANGIEFVSPPLHGEAGLNQAMEVMRALSDFGCTVAKDCGLHVHVEARRQALPLDFFKNLVRVYSMYEPVIDSMMPPSRRASSNTYCRSLTSVSPVAITAARTYEEVVRVATPGCVSDNLRRFFKLNLATQVAYLGRPARHPTVEFRHHSGTLDANKLRMWVMLCLRMVAAAKRSDLGLGPVNAQPLNRARVGSKSWRVGQMMLRPEGVTGQEVMRELAWPSVSMPQQARACGLPFTTQRMGRMVRYFAQGALAATPTLPVTVDGLADLLGSAPDERAYMTQRAANLSGPVAWAA